MVSIQDARPHGAPARRTRPMTLTMIVACRREARHAIDEVPRRPASPPDISAALPDISAAPAPGTGVRRSGQG
jgi:hypothetical protein